MAHNFHDIAGMLVVGIDFHKGVQPLPPPPHPMMYWELVFVHPFVLGPGQHPKVKFNGVNSVVHMHTPLLLWGHTPIIPDPLNLVWWVDWLSGSHIAWLPRTTVKIEGTSAACCVFPGSASINMDCCEAGFLPLSIVFQPGTVQTTPTLKDYLLGAFAVVMEVAFDKAMAKLGDKLFKTKWGTTLRRKAYNKSSRVARSMDKLALKWGKQSGKTGKAAYGAGMDRIDDAIGSVVGNNPLDAGGKALDLLGMGLKGQILSAARGDDLSGPSVPSVPKVISHLTSGAFPGLSKAISKGEDLYKASQGK